MRVSLRLQLAFALISAALAGAVEGAAVHPPEEKATFTVLVRNYAQVDAKTLAQAEKIASEIFMKAAVETRWVDMDSASGAPVVPNPVALSDIQLLILPLVMADRLQLSPDAMGFAPGAGPDRRLVYAFYSGITAYARTQSLASKTLVSPALILGHVMAHEIGQVLLSLQNYHSSTGIMRAPWNSTAVDDARRGYLVFTARQAEDIRTDVARRNGQEQHHELASLIPAITAP